MKRINKIFLLLVALISLYRCNDIIEKDITDSVITTNHPYSSQEIESNVASFQWNAVDGADNYRIQIFASSQNLVRDSLVTTNNVTLPLEPGTYQWRVRGENFAYTTSYTWPLSFTMIESNNLASQQVQLSSPMNNLYTLSYTITLSWNGLSAATSYDLQILKGGLIIQSETGITNTTYNVNSTIISEDSEYIWKVKAKNSGSETPYASRTFYVDRTPPNLPQNLTPIDNSLFPSDSEVVFNWVAPADNGLFGSPMSYQIQISTNQNFTNIIHTANLSVSSYQYTFSSTGNFYWRVKSFDQVGNQGSFTNYNRIQIN